MGGAKKELDFSFVPCQPYQGHVDRRQLLHVVVCSVVPGKGLVSVTTCYPIICRC